MALVGVDWGSSSLRAYLIDASGVVLESVDAAGAGTLALSAGGPEAFATELQALFEKGESPAWLAKDTAVLMTGMVGSSKGWLEVPYSEAPASAADLAAGCLSVSLKDGRQAQIVPGLCFRPSTGAAPDVMRGEETQVLGASDGKRRLFVLPGTHSKWALTSSEGVVSFQTQMTGEFFELLRQHSILKASVANEDWTAFQKGLSAQPSPEMKLLRQHSLLKSCTDDVEDWVAFQKGLSRSGQPGGLLAHAFSMRTESLAGTMTPTALSSYLSGILIGHEVRAGVAAWFSADCGGVTVIGGSTLSECYRRAFAFLHGIEVDVVSGQEAVALGLSKLHKSMRLSQGEAKNREHWQSALDACPVVAILRGIRPEEAVETGKALVAAGVTIIEVPTNSPQVFKSVRLLAQSLPRNIVVGAGTCLTAAHVDEVAAAGGTLVVSPNVEEKVIMRAKALGLICLPGVATPTEAFAALKLGATGLKAFPGEQVPPPVLKAWKAVLPKELTLLAVGGVTVENADTYWNAGISGFGIGSAIYRPGLSAEQVGCHAEGFVKRIQELKTGQTC